MTFRRTPKPAPYTVRVGVTRAGRVGVAIYRDGVLAGWGVNETAAWAAVQVNAAA